MIKGKTKSGFISIHTSVWEVTIVSNISNGILQDFNPHLRMGGDWDIIKTIAKGLKISIHTSVWEVT